MSKSPVIGGAGNVNMKGKKYKVMRCRCCACLDLRDKQLKREHAKMVAEEITSMKDGLV